MPDYALCDGGGDDQGDHCCYVEGVQCPHLVVDGPTGRRYACGLFTELGDWAAVHSDPRYLADVKPAWDRRGVADCGDWMGANRSQEAAVRAAGGFTPESFRDTAQCCFKRRWAGEPNRTGQAVRILNRNR